MILYILGCAKARTGNGRLSAMSHALLKLALHINHLAKRPFTARLAAAIEISALVSSPSRFVVNHLLGRSATYALREGSRVCVRHKTSDPLVIREVFAARAYQPPSGLKIGQGRIVDLGGNIGASALWLTNAFPARPITVFEPDPGNAALLERCAALNERQWTIVHAAASNRGGEMRFRSDLDWGSRLDDTGDITVPTVDVLPYLRDAALVKIDIEGGEWDILTDPRLASVTTPVIVVEHHAHGAPNGNHRLAATTALEAAGYTVHPGEDHGETGLLWGVRQGDLGVGARKDVRPGGVARDPGGSVIELHVLAEVGDALHPGE